MTDKGDQEFQISVRDVTRDDYETVMTIASPYTFRDGFDYLPAKFQHYVDDPDTLFYILEDKGEAATIVIYNCKDDGEALLVKTMRLAPKWIGTGLTKSDGKPILLKMAPYFLQRNKFPKLLYAVLDEQRKDVLKLMKNEPSSTLKCKMNVMYFRCDPATLHQQLVGDLHDMGSLPALLPIQLDNMNQLVQPNLSSTVLSKSEGLVFVDWDPYKLNESNMKRFVESGHHILVDSGKPAAKSLSFGGSYMTPRGRVYHIDVHSTDEILCKAHIISQMKNAQNKYTGMITFCVMLIDEELKDTVVNLCVKNLQLTHLPHDHTFIIDKKDVMQLLQPKL